MLQDVPERFSERIMVPSVDEPVPHIMKEILEWIMDISQKQIAERTGEQQVDVSVLVPRNLERIGEEIVEVVQIFPPDNLFEGDAT